ncbi:MAG TPA: dCMP deaminase family protein [Candidatus Latescibacteria bacterium]|nr:dCMP deaminase family protein [Candidatus Latescibacterota bacterium]
MTEAHEHRLGWDTYFMRIAQLVAERSTCTRAKIGAVIVRERSIIATGYNGSPAGMPHCTEVGCLVYRSTAPDGTVEENCFRTIHAEINAIAQAAKHGNSIDGASIYITATPCIHCLKVLINVGIKRIFYAKPYKLQTIEEMVRISGIELVQVEVEPLPEEMKH